LPTTSTPSGTIRWSDAGGLSTAERGPEIGTTARRRHRAALADTAPTDNIGPYPSWTEAEQFASIDP
jgi:hypothetical protein